MRIFVQTKKKSKPRKKIGKYTKIQEKIPNRLITRMNQSLIISFSLVRRTTAMSARAVKSGEYARLSRLSSNI